MKRGKMKRIKILEIYFSIGLFAAVVALLYVWLASPLGTSDRVGITMAISTVALVIVTGIYAWHTRKMADEMRDARYDALRPIIDIVNMQQMPIELATQAYAKEPPKELLCKLCNIGVGPATDVYSFVYHDSGGRRRRSLDTIVIGKETGPERLSLAQKDDHWFLVAYYKDVYGRWFESSREVRRGAVNPDPLQIREITEEE